MSNRVVGIALIISLLLGACVTTTQTCTNTPAGQFCSDPQPVPDSPAPSDDHTGAIVAVGALVTAVALVAVLYHRGDKPEAPAAKAAPPAVTYIIPPTTDESELRLQRMFVQAHISARAGRCEAVSVIGKKLAVESPSYHARYVADETIARCLTAERI